MAKDLPDNAEQDQDCDLLAHQKTIPWRRRWVLNPFYSWLPGPYAFFFANTLPFAREFPTEVSPCLSCKNACSVVAWAFAPAAGSVDLVATSLSTRCLSTTSRRDAVTRTVTMPPWPETGGASDLCVDSMSIELWLWRKLNYDYDYNPNKLWTLYTALVLVQILLAQ